MSATGRANSSSGAAKYLHTLAIKNSTTVPTTMNITYCRSGRFAVRRQREAEVPRFRGDGVDEVVDDPAIADDRHDGREPLAIASTLMDEAVDQRRDRASWR